MADIVAVYAVPHTPSFVEEARVNGDQSQTAHFFSEIRAHLEAAKPDVIATINNDHYNTFFFDNWPTLAIGIGEQTAGPNDQTPGMPWYNLTIEAAAARHILRSLVEGGFDLTSSVDLELDHGALVPLHFMTPTMALPIVPILVNCMVPPLPSARRCHAFGHAVADAIRSWNSPARVAVITSGSLSLEIGGPRAEVNKTFGVPDPDWAGWVLERIRLCEHEQLVAAASEARMLNAGNVAGELLNWIVALGIVGTVSPSILINQPEFGNAFAAWCAQEEVA